MEYEKNCSSQEDIQIYCRPFFDQTFSFRFNHKKRYQKWKIPFCTKSMPDTKKTFVQKKKNILKIIDFGGEKILISIHLLFKFVSVRFDWWNTSHWSWSVKSVVSIKFYWPTSVTMSLFFNGIITELNE